MDATDAKDFLKGKMNAFPEEIIVKAIEKSKELGDSSFKRREWNKAELHYTEAISGALYLPSRKSMLPALYRNRSSVHFAKHNISESLKDAITSLKFEPKNSKGNYRVARALLKLEKYETAITYFDLAIENNDSNKETEPASVNNKKSLKEREDIEEWKKVAVKGYDDQAKFREVEKMKIRYTIDYSRFEKLSADGESCATHSSGSSSEPDAASNGFVIEPTEAWKELNRNILLPFNRISTEALQHRMISAGTSNGGNELDSDLSSVFTGLSSILWNVSALMLPQRRLRQLCKLSPILRWRDAIYDYEKTTSKQESSNSLGWLVSGLGCGATLVSAARAAKQVTFVGIDSTHPCLSGVLREMLNTNHVRVGFGKVTSAQSDGTLPQSLNLAGLSSLRKKTVRATEPPSRSQEAKVYLHRGTLETMGLESKSSTEETGGIEATRFKALSLDPEMFDEALIGKRIIPALRNAHRYLLKPNARVIPHRAKLVGIFAELFITPDPDEVRGIQFAAQGDRCSWAPSYEAVTLAEMESSQTRIHQKGVNWKQLTDKFTVWDFIFGDRKAMTELPEVDENRLSLRFIGNGRANAIVTWFELDVDGAGDFDFGNRPASKQDYWSQAVNWILPVTATRGTGIECTAIRSDTVTRFIVGNQEQDLPQQLSSDSRKHKRFEQPLTSKVHVRTWEILGSAAIIGPCRDAIGLLVRWVQKKRKYSSCRDVHVLELQCGSTFGLMSMLAIKAGAVKALGCDANEQLIDTATMLTEINRIEGVKFCTVHPSKLLSGDPEQDLLSRPADILLLPIPEMGLLEGGILKMLKTVLMNPTLVACDVMIFPSKISCWAQIIEESHAVESERESIDCSAHLSLIPSESMATPVDLARINYRELCSPVHLVTVDTSDILKNIAKEPSSYFDVQINDILVSSSGRASSIALWWSLDLCHIDRTALKLSNIPGNSLPWIQDLNCIQHRPLLTKGDVVSLSLSVSEDKEKLVCQMHQADWKSTSLSHDAPINCDPTWKAAWKKISEHQQKMNDAMSGDPLAYRKVVAVADAIALDPACIPSVVPGMNIDPLDASNLACAYRRSR